MSRQSHGAAGMLLCLLWGPLYSLPPHPPLEALHESCQTFGMTLLRSSFPSTPTPPPRFPLRTPLLLPLSGALAPSQLVSHPEPSQKLPTGMGRGSVGAQSTGAGRNRQLRGRPGAQGQALLPPAPQAAFVPGAQTPALGLTPACPVSSPSFTRCTCVTRRL